ncbi:hypothetical protein CPB86DRAFT_878568, partial [Serendipita vermifera]
MDSIMLYQVAVDLAPDDHPNKADYLNGLGISLDSRFQCLGNLSDLDRAIITNQAAVNLTPEDHPSKRLCLIGLASAYWSRFRHLSLPDDAETTITLLSSASNSQTGSPVHRFTAATTWISFASFNGHPSLLAAYESAITIMPLVAWLGLSISNRHQRLREIGGITQDAAAAAISLEQYDKALEWLDQGRSIVWNQILQLRTPVDELCDIRPDLAERLFQVSRVLDQGPGQAGPSTLGKESVEEAGRRYRALTTERESLIEQVRSLPKFESFMMPLKSSQLMKSVQDGVVIVLNVAKERCDALTLIPGKDAISHIPLPNITSKRVRELGTELRSLSHSTGIRRRGEHSVIHVEEAHEEHCRQILAELWTTLVKPILDSLNFSPRPLTLPRIWWCATGPLAFLPIHAAGIYNSGSLDDQLSNYAISSYIPTVSTLLGRHNPAVHSSTFRMLSVVQPSAPGTPSIPRTKEELACVKRRLVDQSHVILEGKEGTKARVVKRMKECNWLHLSCHGVQDLEEPTRSALILEDGHLTLEEIIKLDLPNAQFAFLSACQTSSGDEKLSEEAVHIAGGMLLAGYRGVVATMWSIQDELAPEVADKFYAYLMQDEQEPDSRRAAEALHFAIQELHTSVELSNRENCSLTDIAQLILEISLNGQVVDKANLLSRKSTPAVWHADQPLVLRGIVVDFVVSVSMELAGNKRQLLASAALKGAQFNDESEKKYEIPLTCRDNRLNFVLKTKAFGLENLQESLSGIGRSDESLNRRRTMKKFHEDATAAYSDFEQHGKLESLEQAIVNFQTASDMASEIDLAVPSLLTNLGACLLSRFERVGNPVDLDASIARTKEAVNLTSSDDPDKPIRLGGLGSSLRLRFEQFGDVADLEDAIISQKVAVDLVPEGHLERPAYLNDLGNSLETRFKWLGDTLDMDEAITSKQKAVDTTPDHHPNKFMYLSNLGSSLATRFQRLGNIDDINAAVASSRMAVNLTPDCHPYKPACLNNLGTFLEVRFGRLGNPADIDAAIASKQAAVNLIADDHHDKPVYLNSLGTSLLIRFQSLENPVDLDNAVATSKESVDLMPDGHPQKPECLNNLGNSFETRFQQFSNLADLDNAITSKQAAVDLTPNSHHNKHGYLNNLGISLETRFHQLGNLIDIDDSITSKRAAVDLTPDGHPKKSMYLTNLGGSLETRFKWLGKLDDINNAIISNQMAVALIPDSHPDKPTCLNNLGSSLETRFNWFGTITDLDDAINSKRAAINLTPDGHPHKPGRLSNLGVSLQTRFERLGEIVDINNTIASNQAAVDLTPDSHPSKPVYLNNLGTSLLARFEQLGDPVDIKNIITFQQTAVNLTPDSHPRKPVYLSNLAISLCNRFEQSGNLADINQAIISLQEAVKIMPDGHPLKPACSSNLGTCLQKRFQQLGTISDIDESVLFKHASVNLTPEGHYDKPGYLRNLGSALTDRFLRLNLSHDAEAAILHFSAAATSRVGPPMERFIAAEAWISVASLTSDSSLLAAYECAVALMPLVAWLGLPIANRYHHLVEIGGMTRNAAATAISLGQYDKALEWLEQGRTIVWTQILQLRTPVDGLRDIRPDLAQRLVQISRQMDQGPEHSGLSGGRTQSIEDQGRQYRALTTEWESIIEQIRSLPSFESFLRPPTSFQLRKSTKGGNLIVLNIAKEHCDALALLPGLDETIHIPLPNLTLQRVTELANELRDVLHSSGIRVRGERAAKKVEDEVDSECCERILAELWVGLVKPVLDSLAFMPHPDVLPRIWWCATGPLAFLPIHAAGIYDAGPTNDKLSDYAISSYIPTISTVLKTTHSVMGMTFKLLSVVQPSAPGVSVIPNTKKELEYIWRRVLDQNHVVLEGSQGTKKQVMRGMEECNWLHLACHGIQNLEEPTKSALVLEDGHLTLEEIIKLDLPNAQFAFLSACQTSSGDEKLSEEAVHIAGGMLLAGYRGVVATMWSIQDDLAPEVADEFYAHLLQDGQEPDSRRAAEALHFAVQKLRKKN